MGILGGIPANVDHLLHLYNTARKEIGEFNWSVCAAGRHQFPMGVTNMVLGGNMRVGLEYGGSKKGYEISSCPFIQSKIT